MRTQRRAGLGSPEPIEIAPLRERAAYMQVVRVGFALIVAAAIALLPSRVGTSVGLLVSGTGVYLLVAALSHAFRRLRAERALPLIVGLLLLDGLYLAWLMSLTGGTQSPFRFLVYVHVVAVTLLASYRTGLKVTLWHTLLYLLLFEAETTGFLQVTNGLAFEVAALDDGELRRIVLFHVSAFWMVALATAGFSALNERELRHQKIDLEQLSATVAEIDRQESSGDVAAILLAKLHETFGFSRGVVLASPADELSLMASFGDTATAPIQPGLDHVMDRSWSSREILLVKRLDPSADPRLTTLLPAARNVLIVPLFLERGSRLGIVALEQPSSDRIKVWIVSMVRQFASHAALSLHNTWLLERLQESLTEIQALKDELLEQNLSLEVRVDEQTEELRQSVEELRALDEQRSQLLSHIVTAQEEERQRIAGDVHDEPVQRIVALNMRLQLLRRSVTSPEQQEMIDKLVESARTAIRSMRHLLFELRPPALDEQGLGAAIHQYLEEKDPDFAYEIEERLSAQPPSEVRIVLYRIVQEALANAYKHSQAEKVRVTLEERDGGVVVDVEDDGVGFTPYENRVSAPGHLGLSSMRERAELAGGWCELHSLAGGGTTVRVWVPNRREHEEAPAPQLTVESVRRAS